MTLVTQEKYWASEYGTDFVGCGGAVGQSFTKPPSPANPPSSLRPNERNDRATHHRAWDPRAAPPRARYVPRSFWLATFAIILVVDALGMFGVVTRTASRTLRKEVCAAPTKKPFSHRGHDASHVLDFGQGERPTEPRAKRSDALGTRCEPHRVRRKGFYL